MSPACAMHSLEANGEGGTGAQTPVPQAPPRSVTLQARAVRAHAHGGTFEAACAGHAPPSASLVATAAPAAAHSVPVHDPTEPYVPQVLPPGHPPKNIWTVAALQCAFAGLPHEQLQVDCGALGSACPSNATDGNVEGQEGGTGATVPV
jgi:hypothetical protein